MGPYTLGDVLGVGGNATVYRASSDNDPIVALKILHPGKIDTDEQRRFRREFLTLQRLRHDNIVAVHEFGIHGDYPWIAMEYVDGIDLDSQIERWRAAPSADRFTEVERMFRSLCEGLSYVHRRGLIHRDLKPSNILLTADGRPKLSDFGFVKSENAIDTQLTQAGRLVGTVAFMAPEQIMGEPVDSRVDLYSLGAVLYVLLTLQKPIEADSIPGYLARHLTHVPHPPSELDPRVPPHLERICTRLLLKDPAQRFASAQQLIATMDAGAPARQRKVIYGRDPLLRSLLVRLESLRSSTGGVVVIHGPPGIGKSVLLVELVERARAAGSDIARCSGREPAPLETIAAQLPALGVGVDPALRIVAAVRKRPLVLVVDDLDEMKRGHLQRLTGLVRDLVAVEGERLLVVAAVSRDDGSVGGFVSGAATGLTPDRVDLSGLGRRATIALVRDRGVTGAAGAALGHRLHEDLSGQPGPVLDQIEALIEAGWLVSGASGLRSTRSVEQLREAPLPLPPHLRDRQEGALTGLPAGARALLEVLVVLNMEGTAALIRRILGTSAPSLDAAATALVERELIERRPEGTAEVLVLHPSRKRNLLYAIIEPERRAALHRQIAATLRKRSRRLGPMAEIIGHHLLQGGQVAEAWPLLLVAAQRKLRSGKLKTARQLLRLALDAQPVAETALPPDDVQRNRRLLFALEAECRERGGDITGAVSAWEQALSAALAEGDPKTVARIQSGLGLAQTARGDVMLANVGLEEAITHLERGDPMWPRVARALASARLESGVVAGAERLWQELLEMSRATASQTRRAEALAGLGQVALARGELSEGRRLLSEAIPLLPTSTPDPEHARLLLSVAELSLCSGALFEARERAEQAESIARDAQRLMICVRALGISACAAWSLGDDNNTRRCLRSATALMQAVDETESAEDLRARLLMSRVFALLGNLEQARGVLPGEVFGIGPGLDDPIGQQQALQARLLAGRDPGRAIALARSVLERTPARQEWVAARVSLDTAHALRTMERVTAARMALSRADSLIARGGLRLLALEAARLRAALTQGRDGVADASVLRAELFASLGEPPGFWGRWG